MANASSKTTQLARGLRVRVISLRVTLAGMRKNQDVSFQVSRHAEQSFRPYRHHAVYPDDTAYDTLSMLRPPALSGLKDIGKSGGKRNVNERPSETKVSTTNDNTSNNKQQYMLNVTDSKSKSTTGEASHCREFKEDPRLTIAAHRFRGS